MGLHCQVQGVQCTLLLPPKFFLELTSTSARQLLQEPLTRQLSKHREVERSPLAKRIHRQRLAER